MTRRDGHDCDVRKGRLLLLLLVAVFATLSLSGVLHAPAFAAPSDDAPFVATHQSEGGPASHDYSGGQACSAQAHCSGLAFVTKRSIGVSEASAHGLPLAFDMVPVTSVAPVHRPPILSFST